MKGEIEDISQVIFCRDGARESFIEIISRLDLKPPVIIKPNWSTSKVYTEAEILDWTLSALNCEKIVVESCAHYRSPIFLNLDRPIDAEFEKKISKQKKKDLRENDEWFLKLSGIGDVLRQHDVQYLNLSEELWSKRVCEPDQIRSLVESRFEPLVNDNLYSMVPTRLYDMRGGTLLSIAKPKLAHDTIGVTMSVKNLFGMISTPYRGKFHGPNDVKLNDTIIDITKICQSLFDMRGVVEAVFSTSSFDESLMMGQIFRDLGFIWGSNNIFELDVVVTTQLGLGIQEVGHLSQATRIFGEISHQVIESAKQNAINLQ
jgi:uncharacterized protein (DUF362 family)